MMSASMLLGITETPTSMLFGTSELMLGYFSFFRQPVRYGLVPCSATMVLMRISTGDEVVMSLFVCRRINFSPSYP